MNLKVNASEIEYSGADNLAALVESLEMNPKLIAVELNTELVRRANYGQTKISDGDSIEIVTLVGGG